MVQRTLFSLLLLLGLAASGVSGFLAYHLHGQALERRTYAEKAAAQDIEAANVINNILKRMQSAQSPTEWRELMKEASGHLRGKALESVQAVSVAKLFETQSHERDLLLFSAGRLLSLNKNDPLGEVYVNRARAFHEQNEELLNRLILRDGDCEWNIKVWHLQGLHYYRSLVFLGEKERAKARDLLAQAKKQFEKVLYAPCAIKDRAASVAIEMLYQESEKQGAKAEEKDADRIRLFPSKESNPFQGGQGNDPQDRSQGRH